MGKWIKKLWRICTQWNYSAVKKKEALSSATTWMDHEGIMLREVRQKEENKHCMTSLTPRILKKTKGKHIDTDNELAVAKDKGTGWEK